MGIVQDVKGGRANEKHLGSAQGYWREIPSMPSRPRLPVLNVHRVLS